MGKWMFAVHGVTREGWWLHRGLTVRAKTEVRATAAAYLIARYRWGLRHVTAVPGGQVKGL